MYGPFCTVGPATKLGNRCQLHPRCHISGNTKLGEGRVLTMWVPHRTNVLLLHKVSLRERYVNSKLAILQSTNL